MLDVWPKTSMGSTEPERRGPEGRRPRSYARFAIVYGGGAAVLLLAWVALGRWVAPIAIEAVYQGTGVAFLDGLLPGRGEVPLTEYLREWRGVSRLIAASLSSVLLLGFCAGSLLHVARSEAEAGSAAMAPGHGEARESLGALAVVATAAWIGLAFGLLEGYFVAAKAFYVGGVLRELREVSQDSPWMIPLVMTAALAVWGSLLAVARRPAISRPGVVVGTSVFIGALSVAMATAWMAWWACAILAAGIAVQVGRLADPRPTGLVRLVRRTGPVALAVPLGAALLLSAWTARAERRSLAALPAAGSGSPNVLLIVLDTERASNLSLYGYHRATTPILSELAGRGIAFERAIAPETWTLPSHAAMFTGRRTTELTFGWNQPLETSHPMLAEHLRDRGYATAGFVANVFYCSDFYGLNRGFAVWRDQPRNLAMALNSAWLSRYLWTKVRHRLGNRQHLVRKTAEEVNRDFLAWLDAAPARPYFAFLNYFDAHAPYLPPAPFDTLFTDARAGTYWVGGATVPADPFSPGELRHLEDSYDNGIAYVDHQLGDLLSALEARGDLDNTLVIVTSDHGELFGEHGRVGHGEGLHIRLVHVPLLVLLPDRAASGKRVAAPVSLQELPATVLGITHPGSTSPFPGRSLARYWSPEPPRAERSEEADTVVVEHGGERMVITARYHYNVRPRGEGEELYDLVRDPLEVNDLSGDPAFRHEIIGFREYLRSWLDRPTRPARAPGSRSGRTSPP